MGKPDFQFTFQQSALKPKQKRNSSTYDFKIIADKRERRGGWRFDMQDGPPVEFDHLVTADYTLENSLGEDLRDWFLIERKELSDAVNSMTNERERFELEMERLRDIVGSGGSAYVIIEAGINDLYMNHEDHAESIMGTWVSWHHKYSVSFIWGSSFSLAQATAIRLLDLANRASMIRSFKRLVS